jgi:hypothetical protein
MEVSGQIHAPVALSLGKVPRYPLERGLDVSYSRFGRGDQERK